MYELDYEGKASGKHNCVCALPMDQVSFAKFECLGEIFICREPSAPLASQIDILRMREILFPHCRIVNIVTYSNPLPYLCLCVCDPDRDHLLIPLCPIMNTADAVYRRRVKCQTETERTPRPSI